MTMPWVGMASLLNDPCPWERKYAHGSKPSPSVHPQVQPGPNLGSSFFFCIVVVVGWDSTLKICNCCLWKTQTRLGTTHSVHGRVFLLTLGQRR